MADNHFMFESNPYHNVIMKERKCVELSGITQIDHFDDEEFLLESVQGWIEITGKELTLDKLDKERGEVIIKGHINSLCYTSNQKGNKQSLMNKLFK